MRHPDEGTLRRLLDAPAGVADADRRHVADCSQCLGGLAVAIEDPPPAGQVREQAPAGRRGGRVRAIVRRPAVAALAVAVVLAGAGTAAANDWLQIFQTERITPVGVGAGDLVALPDLNGYGTVQVTGGGDVRQVPDAAAAATATGLDVPRVAELPRGVGGEPAYQVGGEVSATFTFSADRAARTAAQTGETLPAAPPGLDGGQVRLVAGPGLAEVWEQPAGVPALVVGRAVAPKAFSTGVPFETVRDYLLSLPGLPADVAARLRTFSGDGSTLPLPVPADEVETSSADVNGADATVLATRDRTMAAVVWVRDGVVTAVAGALDTGEVLTIARNLR
ncbi:hypothetical protein HII36_17700 [Nonomuraea sp. NN258]|uniref:hypothetical protein n=1 Tax=Nonomuraea antri TaxID=2730852 RepID=UPI00156919CA|nr:hypothetical protein [Nonomuraea antri]NRQ33671.1 hypothetical protein [Nonomuraea antri]